MSLTSHHLVLFFVNFADLVVFYSLIFKRLGPTRNPPAVKIENPVKPGDTGADGKKDKDCY